MAGLNGTITMQSGAYRPCTVHGKKALFHKWTEKERMILQNNVGFSRKAAAMIYAEFEKTNVVPNGFTAVKLGGTYAIIEFENGAISLIDPREVMFLDSGNLFHDNNIFFREETIK